MSTPSAYPLGPGAWPSTSASYAIPAASATTRLDVSVALDVTAYQPAADEPPTRAVGRARRDRRRYAAAYEQLKAPGVTAAVLTSLRQAPGADPAPLPVDADVLRRYVLGTYAYLGAVASVGDVTASAASVDALCAAYGVDAGVLGTANAGAVLADLLGTATVRVPLRIAFRAGDTVAALCAAHPPADVVQVLMGNADLPLAPGVELTAPPRTEVVPESESSASDLAALWHCTLPALVAANAAVPGLLAPGFVFACHGFALTVDGPDSETTLDEVAAFFATRAGPDDAAEVVALNAHVPGMFRPGATLSVTGYVTQPGDTLARNESGCSPGGLAAANATTAGLFPAGTSLFLATGLADVDAGVTLAQLATAHGTTPGEVLRHNGDAVPSSAVVPGTWSWPADPTAALAPYTVAAGDTPGSVAQRFGGDVRQVVAASAWLPGTVAAGVTVTIGETPVTTTAPSSFDDVCALSDPPADLEALAVAVGARADVLVPGALLVCPPGVLPGTGALTPAEAAAPYGITPAALLSANAGTPDLLVPGTTLVVSTATVRTAEHDTLTAVVGRFRRAGVVTSVAEVVADNAAVAFVRPGARVLVPPADGLLGVADGAAWTFPSAVFPVGVSVTVSRAATPVEPPLRATPAAPERDPVPGLWFATAAADDGLRDAWAVVFGPGGVTKLAIEPAARAYAIRPLATTPASGSVALPDGTTRSYRDADPEVWARRFLSDVERVVSGSYARGARELDPAAHDRLAAAKETLAGAVSRGLAPVADSDDTGVDAAAETLWQRLLVSLPDGYATAAAVQYDTDVASPWTEPYARLLGTAEPAGAHAAVSLTNGAGTVTFLVDAPDVGEREHLDLAWAFRISDLEHGVEQASRMTFADPFTVELGSTTVPLALRAYPSPPVLSGHDAQVSAEAGTLDAALHWDYVVTVAHRAMAQDGLGLTVTFNAPPAPAVTAAAPSGDGLVTALARYVMWAPSPLRDRQSLTTYADLVSDVADAWARHWETTTPASLSGIEPQGADVYELEARLVAGDDGSYVSLDLTRTPVTGLATVGWPTVAWVDGGGTAHELTTGEPTGVTRRYAFPAGVPAFAPTTLRVTFAGLHVAAYQSATTHARVERNAGLPAAFVYRTPDTGFASPVVPYVDGPRPIRVADWSDTTLAAVFGTVLDGAAGLRVSVEVAYAYPLGQGAETLLPVLLTPPMPYDPETMPSELTAQMDAWLADRKPETAGASWAISVTLYSSADPLRPLARLDLSSALAAG